MKINFIHKNEDTIIHINGKGNLVFSRNNKPILLSETTRNLDIRNWYFISLEEFSFLKFYKACKQLYHWWRNLT